MNPRVLICDDEAVIAGTLTDMLNKAGFDARATHDASEAIAAARSWHPSVFVTDVYLGKGMNGVDAAIAVSAFLPECKIVLMSGHAPVSSLMAAATADGWMFEMWSKPFKPEALMDRIRQLAMASS